MKQTKTLAQILLISLLLNFSLQCSPGCLTCTLNPESQKICSFCDLFNFFKSDGKGGCIKISPSGCRVPSYDFTYNTCFKCQPGLIYDTVSHKCTWPSSGYLQDRCDEYDFDYGCLTCQGGYYPDGEGNFFLIFFLFLAIFAIFKFLLFLLFCFFMLF
jgi:hypothetical protein